MVAIGIRSDPAHTAVHSNTVTVTKWQKVKNPNKELRKISVFNLKKKHR